MALTHHRINAYRTMWLLVLFDLPTETKKERKAASQFRKILLQDGFNMFQFSCYMRHCPSRENAEVHSRRIQNHLPLFGHVGVFYITDKQWGMTELFFNTKAEKPKTGPQQLEFF
ncbi:MAG: CRISPR-associated endonuclease Cas2 [Bacteroidetes bacterium]|nr:MAG: CRISPR-associated endonuclease Cas2 [Bacteroidota bacterium]